MNKKMIATLTIVLSAASLSASASRPTSGKIVTIVPVKDSQGNYQFEDEATGRLIDRDTMLQKMIRQGAPRELAAMFLALAQIDESTGKVENEAATLEQLQKDGVSPETAVQVFDTIIDSQAQRKARGE